MLFSKVTLGAALVATAYAANAPAVTNPIGASYHASFVAKGNSPLNGEVVISSFSSGQGALVQVTVSGLPGAYSVPNYLYHIHTSPVPANGDCAGTGGHLDPQNRGEDPPCNPADPANCQVGDLSGKHGVIPSGNGFTALYQDLYISTDVNNAASVNGRSIVFHYPNKTRIACANLVQIGAGSSSASLPSGYGSSTAASKASSSSTGSSSAGSCGGAPASSLASSTSSASAGRPTSSGLPSYSNSTATGSAGAAAPSASFTMPGRLPPGTNTSASSSPTRSVTPSTGAAAQLAPFTHAAALAIALAATFALF